MKRNAKQQKRTPKKRPRLKKRTGTRSEPVSGQILTNATPEEFSHELANQLNPSALVLYGPKLLQHNSTENLSWAISLWRLGWNSSGGGFCIQNWLWRKPPRDIGNIKAMSFEEAIDYLKEKYVG